MLGYGQIVNSKIGVQLGPNKMALGTLTLQLVHQGFESSCAGRLGRVPNDQHRRRLGGPNTGQQQSSQSQNRGYLPHGMTFAFVRLPVRERRSSCS